MRNTLSKKQKGYAEHVTKGIPKDRSAIMAGATVDNVPFFEASPLVRDEIKRIRQEVLTNTGLTREQIIEMFQEAANFARIIGDPMSLIAAAREMGKMLGFYAPEVKKTLHGIDVKDLRKALKDMNDDDLYKLAHAKTIDGEAVSVVPREKATIKLLQEDRRMQDVYPEEGVGDNAGGPGRGPQTEETSTS